MAKTPFTTLLRQAFAASVKSDPALQQALVAWRESRRQFIKNSVLAAGALLLPGPEGKTEKNTPDIAIVGGGMAGLHAAYRLKKQGLAATVYEASARTGGRMFTLRDRFGPGLTTDIGGEFVDATHKDIIELAAAFGAELYDLRKDTLVPKTFYFAGKTLGQAELRAAILPYVKPLMKDILSLPPLIDHTTAESFRHLDALSITGYLQSLGIGGWLFDFLVIVLTNEYGMEADEQSAINFLIMFTPPLETEPDYELFGESHEVMKIKGGSQHLTDLMYAALKDQVRLGHRLTRLRDHAAGRYELSFDVKGKQTAVQADYVLLAIPFTVLRTIACEVPLPPEKRRCIDEIGYGNSCKFVVGVREKPWRRAGSQGYTFTDESFRTAWDSSQAQSEDTGSFTVFGGGKFSDHVRTATEQALADHFSGSFEKIFPGMKEAVTGTRVRFCWADNSFTRGAYSSFRTGQWAALSGWEGTPVGRIFFAGEHVSKEFQGYMNGAAETGRVAADNIVKMINGRL